MAENFEKTHEKEKIDNELSVIIKGPEPAWDTTFPKTVKVSEVIAAYVAHFKLAPSPKYDLKLESDPNTVLKPERPLVSYQVKDSDVLVFVDFGDAV
jgi:hypothetical protein